MFVRLRPHHYSFFPLLLFYTRKTNKPLFWGARPPPSWKGKIVTNFHLPMGFSNFVEFFRLGRKAPTGVRGRIRSTVKPCILNHVRLCSTIHIYTAGMDPFYQVRSRSNSDEPTLKHANVILQAIEEVVAQRTKGGDGSYPSATAYFAAIMSSLDQHEKHDDDTLGMFSCVNCVLACGERLHCWYLLLGISKLVQNIS